MTAPAPALAVVDYGVNNLRSVVRALEAAGQAPVVTADADVVARAGHVVVPGVGHWQQARKNLAQGGLDEALVAAAARGTPVLGICLGLQLFFAGSEEAPGVAGLDLLPGRVQRFRTALPVPHVGWARVDATAAGAAHPVTGTLRHGEDAFFYHVHSFHPAGVPASSVLATADYDGAFPTIVARDNVLGAQFHPEKSQRAGQRLLAAFAAWRP